MSLQALFNSEHGPRPRQRDPHVSHRNHDTGELFLFSDLTILIIYLKLVVS